jgi:hypothetical protein
MLLHEGNEISMLLIHSCWMFSMVALVKIRFFLNKIPEQMNRAHGRSFRKDLYYNSLRTEVL